MIFTNKAFDVLKWITLIVLPAIGTLYFGLSNIWGLPYGEQVVGTITAIDTFLGVIIGVSTHQYNKSPNYGDGMIRFDSEDFVQGDSTLELETPVKDLAKRGRLALRVEIGDSPKE